MELENNTTTPSAALLGAPAACLYLGVSRATLYKLIELKELPGFRIIEGGRWKFRKEDLDEWLLVQRHRSMERRSAR